MRKRSIQTTFNLSFLDIMFCGFGAVVLLVLIINANMIRTRKIQHRDLRAEVVRLQLEVTTSREYMEQQKNSLEAEEQKLRAVAGKSDDVLARTTSLREKIADLRQQTTVRKEDIHTLKTDLEAMDREASRLDSEVKVKLEQGNRVRRFEGEGNRQYLTGLKLGGRRILLLIDSSASMLDETLVNIIRRRNMDALTKQQSPKWQRAIRTAEWLIANLPPESRLQVYDFNTRTDSLAGNNPGSWVQVTDAPALNEMITKLHSRIPGGGTSLENAFRLAGNLQPLPDNILLITDGLPTQGTKISNNGTVSGEQRIQYFDKAIKILPGGIPVNTILFPMEGDPMAAMLFWKLAIETRGSFFTPSGDWP